MGKKSAKKANPEKAAKAAAKKKALQAEAAKQATLKVAKALGSPLEALPPAFCAYNRNGTVATIEHYTPATLPKDDLVVLHKILDENMAPIYGEDDWESEARADKHKELLEDECRLLLVRRNSAEQQPASPAASPVKDAADGPDDDAADSTHDIAAFMHYRYEIEEECLLLYIYELQVTNESWARRKGLGKFLLMLAEMIAKKANMGGVMLTCQRTNEAAAEFYKACKYTLDEISPSKVDPYAGEDDYNHEIFSKLWSDDVKATLAKRGAEARAVWAADHDGRVHM